MLEPSAGDGVFIDAVLRACPTASIEAIELNPNAARLLQAKYSGNDAVTIHCGDTLLDPMMALRATSTTPYDRVVGNPPYGGWQDFDKRKALRALFPDMYVKETYGLFLFRGLSLLAEGGILTFIVPDTFLSLHMHKELRRILLCNSRILDIAAFPSTLFPGVSFGYSGLCIITLQRCSDSLACNRNNVTLTSGFRDAVDLLSADPPNISRKCVRQADIFSSVDHTFFVKSAANIVSLVNNAHCRLGDVASCVTGLYTGNDKVYLRPISGDQRNAKSYDRLDKRMMWSETVDRPPLDGVEGDRHFIPIVKGGAASYWKPDQWFINWSREAVRHYQTDKRGRFQNSSFYFRDGLAVPMVSSSRLCAWIMNGKVFDQSIVGVFPNDPKWLSYLLAFFNSPTAHILIRAINPTANNSANYLKKLPFIEPNPTILHEINGLVDGQIERVKRVGYTDERADARLRALMYDLYGV